MLKGDMEARWIESNVVVRFTRRSTLEIKTALIPIPTLA
jgi:hypothetical protein